VRLRVPGLIAALIIGVSHAVAAQRATVRGVVFDSIAGRPLPAATVQIAGDTPDFAGRATTTDSAGRYSFADLPSGRYMLGFLHPVLDSIGVDLPLSHVDLTDGATIIADLGIPSARRMRRAICGAGAVGDSGGVVIGTVRQARDRASVPRARVVAEWSELALTSRGLRPTIARRTTESSASGWFALCNVPRTGIVALSAYAAGDSVDRVDVDMPDAGFLRRELYVGRVPSTLHGVVVSAEAGRPLPNVQVSVVGGGQTRTDESGAWTLTGVPAGTRMVESRAIGFLPDRRAVDVIPEGPAIRTPLSSIKAVLDTVRISATRAHELEMQGFEERRQSTTGRFVTTADVARARPIVTTQLLRNVPGLYLERDANGEPTLTMRGIFEPRCRPGVYIDGRYMNDIGAEDIDDWVQPEEIAGIEIYSGTEAPARFTTGMAGVGRMSQSDGPHICGSIVVWTRLRSRSP
jgi:hypothetical protein